jgi:hypothetical protein
LTTNASGATIAAVQSRALRTLLPLLVLALVAAACSSSPSASPTASPSAPSPSGTATAQLASPSASATAAVGAVDENSPANRRNHIVLDDPAIDVELPVGWREVSVAEWKSDIAELPSGASMDQDFIDRLDSGEVLSSAEGYTEQSSYVQMTMSMKRGPDATIRDATARISEFLAGTGPVDNVETGAITTPLGEALAARYDIGVAGNSPTALPARLAVYVIELGSAGILVIDSVGLQSDPSHLAMVDTMVSTIRPSSLLDSPAPAEPWTDRIEDAHVQFVYPETFMPVPLAGTRDSLAEHIETGDLAATPDARRSVDQIDAGILRGQLASWKPLGKSRYIRLRVVPGDSSLEDAARRALQHLGNPDVLERGETKLPIGPAAWMSVDAPEAKVPVIRMLYVVNFPDGISMSIEGVGYQADPDFPTILAGFLGSLRPI